MPVPITLPLATIGFSRSAFATDAERARAEAVARRRTDRLPFAPPERWDEVDPLLRAAVDAGAADLDVLDDDARSQLADASRLSEAVRRYDSSYHAELRWWTSQEGDLVAVLALGCCRALKLPMLPSLSMHTKYRVVRRRDGGVLDMMVPHLRGNGGHRHTGCSRGRSRPQETAVR